MEISQLEAKDFICCEKLTDEILYQPCSVAAELVLHFDSISPDSI